MAGMQINKFSYRFDRKLLEGITGLILVDFVWLRRPFLTWLRFAWRNNPAPTESIPKQTSSIPSGPFVMEREQQRGDLLLWVPRSIDGLLIDDFTGRYGYSHLTVDTGEIDLPTGKPVMAEATIGQVAERKYQDEYGSRFHLRVPLSKTGVDVESFVNCVKSKFGERYDDLEALTLAEIDDPAKQICTSLASDCLPEQVLYEIAKARRLGCLHGITVSVHSPQDAPKTRIFISPNGFAEYYGAPQGDKLDKFDTLIEPRPLETASTVGMHMHTQKTIWTLVAAGSIMGVWLLARRYSKYIKG